jgi:leucine dehydrogenase
MAVFANAEFDSHKSVHQFHDRHSGLYAIVAIHSTALGPAAGGCRLWHYPDEDAALTDALRLSRGMTYKNAIAGLPFGGGKAVLLAQPGQQKTHDLFEAFGRFVDSLQGQYVTAEDVGVTTGDMRVVKTRTSYVSGLPQNDKSVGGDPSPKTAHGVLLGIKSAVERKFGADRLKGLRVGVQGIGNVGYQLCKLLRSEGAILTVADVNTANIERLRQALPAELVDPSEILSQDVDVLAPCALGAVLNSRTIPSIKAKVIAGAANNQLATDQDGYELTERGILYAPDYVINAGGIISVAREYLGGSTVDQVAAEVNQIPGRLAEIFAIAERSGRPTHVVADEMAQSIVAKAAPPAPSLASCA